MKIKQAVILAGGKGTRLKPYTDHVPKPLVPVNGNPFLDYLIFSLVEEGITDILLLLGYKSELIFNRYNDVEYKNIKFNFSMGETSDKTGKRIIDAYDKLERKFLLLYGDNYWPLNLNKMINQYKHNGASLMTTVYENKDGTGEYGFENNIIVSDDNIVVGYDKERKNKKANGVDIGYFIIDKDVMNIYSNANENVSFERDIIPKIVNANNLSAFLTNDKYYYITNEAALKNFEKVVSNRGFISLPVSQY